MPTLNFNIKYKISTQIPISAQDIRDQYLVGFPDDFKCNSFVSDQVIEKYIESAIAQIQSYLGILISQTPITENKDYFVDDWVNWGFIKATYPVVMPVALAGYIGTIKQIDYPLDWVSSRKTTDGKTYAREFRIVPVTGSVAFNGNSAYVLAGWSPQINWWRTNRNLPGYWQMTYITGFPADKIPADILNAVGMLAVIPLLGIISDAYMGSKGIGWGVASKSISIDGLSQSVSSFANGEKGVFGARMKQYVEQLYGDKNQPGLLNTLKDAYSAIIMAVC